jgi:peptidoglycan hydrolase FlgJ
VTGMAGVGGAGLLSGNVAASAENPKLKSAAHEFEASLMQELLKPMQKQSLFADGADGDEDGDDSQNALTSFGSEAMAKAISERGGFGIATKIIEHFEKAGAGAAAKASGKAQI